MLVHISIRKKVPCSLDPDLLLFCYKQNMGFLPQQSQHRSSAISTHPPPPQPMPSHTNSPILCPQILISLSLIIILFFSCCLSLDEQGLALLSWKQTLNLTADALNSWRSSDPNPCKWYGISCGSNNDVVGISIKSVNLQGPLPSNLQSLKFLNTLVLSATNITGPIPRSLGSNRNLLLVDLSKNRISGEIPEEVCGLIKLQSLALNSNSLEGSIPTAIGNLSSLTYLTLYDNYLTGEIPTSIGELKRLEVFRAGGNQNLNGSLPLEIGNCSNLIMLGLAETGISGTLPSTIGSLKRIQTIAMYTSFLSGSIPKEIGNCSELTSLYLYQNSLSGSIPPEVGELRKLQTLLLWQNGITGSIPWELGRCRDLELVDLSLNLLTGTIPGSIGNLWKLQQLQLSTNQLSGTIPPEISNCGALTDLEVDNNKLSGEIKIEFEKMGNLTLFYAWQNRLTGNIPGNLSECRGLQSLDLSYNNLTGPIPRELFGLQNLTKLLVLSNQLSGFIPPEIGNCTNLFRLRLNGNRISGTIPAEVGNLKNLNFLDMSNNGIMGQIPAAISGCENLQFLDFHSNGINGGLPAILPKTLQVIDVSDNRLTGPLSSGIGSLIELTKLSVQRNRISGEIPPELGLCSKLQLLDMGDNALSGEIPPELGRLPALEISLNLSSNRLTGVIPSEFSNLEKLGCFDISHNKLAGSLDVLAGLENLVSLNVSFNEFSGELPKTQFFQKLPLSDFEENHGLRIGEQTMERTKKLAPKLVISIAVSASAVLLLVATYLLLVRSCDGPYVDDAKWQVTLYQKLDLSVDDVFRGLTSSNVIGTGSSGIVYRVDIAGGDTVAVKRLWSEDSAAFGNEIAALGSIRHRNIVRLLGWAASGGARLLFYSYLPNGSLSGLLHGGGKGSAAVEWEARYEIALGIAHAVAYLHHDCAPPILHGDIKALNVLLGPRLEPYLADFGLARILRSEPQAGAAQLDPKASPHIAGSYGYMAPEHGSMRRITEKSDVYSYGVVLLEVLTGRHPLDPTLPGGAHLVQWARDHLQSGRDPSELLDSRLRSRPDYLMQQMLQALAISVLCVGPRAHDRPTMKDVVALLKEIRRPVIEESKVPIVDPTVIVAPVVGAPGSSNCSFAAWGYSS